MPQSRSTSQSDVYTPSYPLAIAMLVGYSFLISLTALLVLAVLVSRDAFMAQPPRISWKFVAVFAGGTWTFALLQFGLLYWLKDRRFWPGSRQEWIRRIGPVLPVALAALLPGLAHAWNPAAATAGITMLLGVTVGIIPTMLCFGDWLKHRTQRVEEIVQLRAREATQLPRAVRAHFDHHTDQLTRLGFEQLGDFQLKLHSPMFARFFLNRERDVYAEISHLRVALFPIRIVCFFSLTPEGRYLESSRSSLIKAVQTPYFEIQIASHRETSEIYHQHVARLRELDRGSPRLLGPELLESVVCYGNKRLYEHMIAKGWASKNPYADFDEWPVVPQRPETAAGQDRDQEVEYDLTINV